MGVLCIQRVVVVGVRNYRGLYSGNAIAELSMSKMN